VRPSAVSFLRQVSGPPGLFLQILVNPSAWSARLAALDSRFEPGTSLSDFYPLQDQAPAVRRLVLQGVVQLPLMFSALVALAMFLWGRPPLTALGIFIASFEYGLVAALILSAGINLTAGFVFGGALSLFLGFMPYNGATLFYPLAASAGLAGSALLINLPNPFGRNWAYELRGLSLALAGSAVLLYVSYTITSGSLTGPDPLQPGSGVLPPAERLEIAVLAGAVMAFVAGLVHRLRWPGFRALVPSAALIGLFFSGTYYGMTTTPMPVNLAFAGIGGGLMLAYFFSLAWNLASRAGGLWVAATVGAFIAGIGWMPVAPYLVEGFTFTFDRAAGPVFFLLLAISQGIWRPVLSYLPANVWNRLLFWSDQSSLLLGRPHHFSRHAAFWDDLQRLPWVGLEQHLLLLAAYRPAETQQYIRRLAGSRQGWAARETQIELAARRLEQCRTLNAIGQAHHETAAGDLAGPASALLQNFSQVSRDIEAALNQISVYHTRVHLGLAVERMDRLERELVVSREDYAARFAPVLSGWLRLARARLDELSAGAAGVEVENPYIFGMPLDSSTGLFIGRDEVIAEIEQTVFSAGHPPMLLSAGRRMGKTSLLLNLAARLPERVVPLLLDGQSLGVIPGPGPGRVRAATQQIDRSTCQFRGVQLPPFDEAMAGLDFALAVNDWIARMDAWLGQNDRLGLVMVDEVEHLMRSPDPGEPGIRYFLDIFRHVSQHHKFFRLLASSSRPQEEIEHWSGYLVSAHEVRLGCLSPQETRRLIERPVEGFALQFAPGVVDRLAGLTGGHPHLTQLVCHELVDLKNTQAREFRCLVGEDDVEIVLPRVLHSGSMFFMDMEQSSVPNGSAAFLEHLARAGSLPLADLEARFNPALANWLPALVRHEILAVDPGGTCRFKIELVRRWFAWPERTGMLL